MIYNVVLVSAVQQSESVIHIHISSVVISDIIMIILKTNFSFSSLITVKPVTLIFVSLDTQHSACHEADTHTHLLNELKNSCK